MSNYKPIMEEALDEVKRKGLLRIQEKVFGASPDPLADLVARFSAALLEKLRAAEQKYGRKDDWLEPNWEADCQRQLLEHVAKGDPRDVAAYAAFCWHHGWPTNHLPAQPQPVEVWKPVETAPKDVEVLMCWEVEWPERRWEYASGLWGSTRGGWNHGQATHWMPLPSSPVSRPHAGAAE